MELDNDVDVFVTLGNQTLDELFSLGEAFTAFFRGLKIASRVASRSGRQDVILCYKVFKLLMISHSGHGAILSPFTCIWVIGILHLEVIIHTQLLFSRVGSCEYITLFISPAYIGCIIIEEVFWINFFIYI